MRLYALLLGAFIAALLFTDFARFGRQVRRVFWLELSIFAAGLVFLIEPEVSQKIANVLGIGRGVDAVIYALLVWLVRESILMRYQRWEDDRRNAELVRALALDRPLREPR
jgi:hypothetical protein